MVVGVPAEVKDNEYRVALTPAGAEALAKAGRSLLVQSGAGRDSGFTDDFYARAGAEVVATAEEVWARADLILKVKEPVETEWPLIRPDQVLFGYFHFAASRPLTEALVESGAVAVAYETVGPDDGQLPLLTPMSEVAGRMAIQQGAKHLETPLGGSGILLGGVPGVLPAKVLILGGGVVGTHAARMAAGLGARVAIMDVSLSRLRQLEDTMPANVNLLYSTRYAIRKQLRDSDLVVGAVLLAGKKAPMLVKKGDLATMRPGSVIVDVAVDQGGCVETIRPTTHEDPVYEVDGIVHYGVTNIPGAVPRTSTLALTNATLPYALRLASAGWERACAEDPDLARGVNVARGKVTHRGVAEAFDMKSADWRASVAGGDAGARNLDAAAEGGPAVRFKRLDSNPDLALPARATPEAAGHDIRSCESFSLAPGRIHAAATGLVMELPRGVECQVRPRSGLAARLGLTLPNSPGTIDPDYRGELKILVQNLGTEAVEIRRGDRIAQLVFSRFVAPEVREAEEVAPTERGRDGFGSTGVN